MSNILVTVQQLIEELHSHDIQIVTVDSYDASNDLAYVIRTGQSTPDAQGYPHLSSYSSPVANDVALLERVDTGWVLTGKIGAPDGGGTSPAAHNLIDTTGHTAAGLTDGHFLRATGATTYAFEAVTPADLGAADTDHSADHATGGSDALTAADIGAADTSHADTHYEDGSDELDRVQTVVKKLTNKSGGQVDAGDVVRWSSSADDAFTTTDVSNNRTIIGVALETIANDAVGQVAVSGYVGAVQVAGTASRGQWLTSSSTVKKAAASGADTGLSAFGVALSAGTDTTVKAILFGMALPEITLGTLGGAADEHALVDTTGHPVSGLTTDHVLKATGATTYGFGALPAHVSTHAEGGADALNATGSIATDFGTAPSLRQNGSAVTQTVNAQTYHKVGKLVNAWIKITADGAGTANTQIDVTIDADIGPNLAANAICGEFEYLDSGTASYAGVVRYGGSNNFIFVRDNQGQPLGYTGGGGPTIAANDFIAFHVSYPVG